jgi:hypothetical protein
VDQACKLLKIKEVKRPAGQLRLILNIINILSYLSYFSLKKEALCIFSVNTLLKQLSAEEVPAFKMKDTAIPYPGFYERRVYNKEAAA